MEVCFNCGSTRDITWDHIPPQNFFPSPKPSNLIKVKCCSACNQGFSMDDEAFRIFASSLKDRSLAGAWIWTNKVLNSSFRRSVKLKMHVAESLVKIGKSDTGMAFPKQRAINFLTRITKGLIKFHYPSIDYSLVNFRVTQIIPSQELLDNTLSKFVYDYKGEGVFRYWRGFYSSEKPESVWVYVFYDALMFLVEVN